MRQLGMLAAVGATDRHLKLVLIVHGAVVGVVAALSGTALGLVGWIALSHRLEGNVAHRIDTFDLPWALLLGALIAGVVVPIAAAWWPSRAMPRMSIVDAISARPPKPRRADASALLAIIFLAGGAVLTGLSNQTKPPLLIGGMIAIVVGILLACPTAIRSLARTARRAPVTVRIALRDLGRYQARAGAALAAISLALGIPIAIILVASAADRTSALHAGKGNLAETQLLVRLDRPTNSSDDPEMLAPNLTEAQLAEVQAAVDDVGVMLGNATIVALEMAADSVANPVHPRLVDLAEPVEGNDHVYHALTAYLATPQLLSFLGVDTSTIPSDAEVLTANEAAPIMPITRSIEEPSHAVITLPEYTSLPKAFITQAGLDRYHLAPAPVGWILQAPHPVTHDQLTAARKVATENGFTIEARHGPTSRTAIRTIATAAGALFALAIVATTVGTIRSEAAGELRTLTATGASGSIRRALTATTAAALAVAGVVLGVIGAYLGLGGAYARHLDRLGDVPVANLLTALIGVPILAGAVGWCLGGREPPSFARPALD
jgi:putative ABC transport system permease protein